MTTAFDGTGIASLRRLGAVAACAAVILLSAPQAAAEAGFPDAGETIVARLPALPPWVGGAAMESSPEEAVARAAALLEAARREGDARLAGLAAGVLARWRDPAADPVEVVVMQATVDQHLHRFERAETLLRAALRRAPRHAQGWLTLATVLRVRGRLGESDHACRAVARGGATRHARACLLENAAWRGEHESARRGLEALIASAASAPEQAWLLGTLALAHELRGDPQAAEAAYRQALRLGAGGYERLALADLLLARQRAPEVPDVLAGEPASDAVLLRRAFAARAMGSDRAAVLADELRRRFQATARRGAGQGGHDRERAMFLLHLDDDPAGALRVAERNLALQREPADLLLFARAARAAGDRSALERLRRRLDRMGVSDARIDAIGG